MRPDESFLAQPVRSLQTMLRHLGEYDSRYYNLVPDGIYGSQTMTAVSNFQRIHGLPVTGMADNDTWDAIYLEYEEARIHLGEAEALNIILDPKQVIRRGDTHPHIHLLQGMLAVLADVYALPQPSRNGMLDAQTADSIAAFQALSLLPATGELDKVTWRHLALQYPLAANQDL